MPNDVIRFFKMCRGWYSTLQAVMARRLLSTLPEEHLLKVDEVLKADFELLNNSHKVSSACNCPQLALP